MANLLELPIPYSALASTEEQLKFITLVKSYKHRISCLYFPIGMLRGTDGSFGIRMPSDSNIVDYNLYELLLKEILEELRLPVKVLFNDIYPHALNLHWKVAMDKLYYYSKLSPIQSVVIADMSLLLKEWTVEVDICLSTNASDSLDSLAHTLMYDTSKMVKSIVLPRDVNRSPELIAKFIKKHTKLLHGISIILMVNEGCTLCCPYKQSGDVEILLNNMNINTMSSVHRDGCTAIKNSNPWMFLAAPFLTLPMLERPEYEGMKWKIAGRNLDTKQLGKILGYYCDGKDTTVGNITNIHQLVDTKISRLPDKLIEDVLKCDKDCSTCMKCSKHYDVIQNIDYATE